MKCCVKTAYDFTDSVPTNSKAPEKDGPVHSGDENEERGNWSGKFDFLLSTIGYAVGLGNVWRFPYKAYASGGASFLIPYIIFLATAGLPLFFMEMGLGQFSSLGPISVWRVVPFFKGLGYAMVIISALVCIYYNLVIAYTLYYLFASFTSELPWQRCKEEWIEKYGCFDRTNPMNETLKNKTLEFCYGLIAANQTNTTEYRKNCTALLNPETPGQIYWDRVVLDISDGIEDGMGDFKWQLVLCLLLAWIIIFVCLCKGIKSSGKVVYVTATFPYIILIILMVRGCTLDGAIEGIKFYIIPDLSRLGDASVWYSAASQIFYSLGVAFGGLETMASYNRFRNNVYRDSILVAVINCATSVFAGFVIFSVLGHMATVTGVPIEKVAKDGPGLAFVVYPEGISLMPVAPLWSILFFIMLFTLGLDSQFAMMETVISALSDEFPSLRRKKVTVTLITCIILFLLGLPQCTRAGYYVMYLFEWYSAGFSLMIVSIMELIGVGWIYGYKRFGEDMKMMVGFEPNIYWTATWLFITPGMILFILIFSFVTVAPISLGTYVYPAWADGMGWLMVALAVFFIPLFMLIEYCKAHGFFQTMGKVLRPDPRWGPALDKFRTGRYEGTSANKPSKQALPMHSEPSGKDNAAFDNHM